MQTSPWSSSWSSFQSLSSFDDHGGHGIWHDHHFQKDDHGHHVFELLYDTLCMKTTMRKIRMMTMVIIFWMMTMAAMP